VEVVARAALLDAEKRALLNQVLGLEFADAAQLRERA
jgi:hypothetical protein